MLLGSQSAVGSGPSDALSSWWTAAHQTHTNFASLDLPAPRRYEPLFGAELSLLPIIRSHSDSYDLVTTDGVSGPVTTIAKSDVLDPEAQLGGRFAVTFYNLSRRLPGLDTDVIYLGYSGLVGNEVVSADGYPTTDVLPSFFHGIPATPVPSYSMFFNSELDSVEWLIGYRPIQRLRFTAGMRWVRLKESFDVLRTAELVAGERHGFYSDSRNELFGWQVGAEATIWTNGAFRVFGKAKYAGLNNDASGNAVAENIQFIYDGETDTSLVDVELGISAPLTSFAAITVSYQGLFLDDAAGGFEQSAAQSFFDTSTQTAQFHDIDWHAMNIALSLLW